MDGSGDLTDEWGTKSEVFRASDINPFRKSSDIADEVAESPIETSGRVHPSLRSVVRTEGAGCRVAGSTDVESDDSETSEVSDSSLLRESSNIAESLAESPIVMFSDRGNSL